MYFVDGPNGCQNVKIKCNLNFVFNFFFSGDKTIQNVSSVEILTYICVAMYDIIIIYILIICVYICILYNRYIYNI